MEVRRRRLADVMDEQKLSCVAYRSCMKKVEMGKENMRRTRWEQDQSEQKDQWGG